jgi:DNA-binding NarL/FixJ family response regulator
MNSSQENPSVLQSSGPQKLEQPIRVALLDDHAVVRQGTLELIQREPGFSVVGEAPTITQLIEQLSTEAADVLLLDINLPEGNALRQIPMLKAHFPALKILAFTAHAESQYIRQALQEGADGFLSKLLDGPAICEAIRNVLSAVTPVLSEDIQAVMAIYEAQTQALHLTEREQEMLLHVAKGLTNQEIARQLCLSVKTVDSHVASLIKKMNVSNRTQLLAQAYAQHLI